jgi:hypothetical protein
VSLRKYTSIRMHVVGADEVEALKQSFRGHAMCAKYAGRKQVYDVTLTARRLTRRQMQRLQKESRS